MEIDDVMYIYAIAMPFTLGIAIALYTHLNSDSKSGLSTDKTNTLIIITLLMFGLISFGISIFWNHSFE